MTPRSNGWVICMLLACSASVLGHFLPCTIGGNSVFYQITFLESKKGTIGIFVSVSVRAG